ncbi:MAG TPA: OmpA family protein [Polyangia bacterium]|jgi:outer membrane protein OmpA-like peptidoglycan-associated protein
MRLPAVAVASVAFVACPSSLAPAFGDTAPPSRVVVAADRLALKEPIAFDAGKATLTPPSRALLDEAARALADNAWIERLEVGVHSDERGADEYNLRISADRAAAIVAYLVAHGVAPARVQAHGYGETRPLCREHNEACWARNRRVELLVVKGARK